MGGDPASEAEFFFGADGRMENRFRVEYSGFGSGLANLFGVWKVNGEAIEGKVTSGWSVFSGESPEPIEPDTEFTALQAEIVAGEPRTLKLTDCEDGGCSTTELRYVGSGKAFTLPVVNANTGIRRGAGRLVLSRSHSGRLSMKVKAGSRYYDLMGRPGR